MCMIPYALTLCLLGNFSCFFSSADFFSKSLYSENSFRNTIRISNNLDPYQAYQFVRPDLSPSCLLRLSADDTSMQRIKYLYLTYWLIYLSASDRIQWRQGCACVLWSVQECPDVRYRRSEGHCSKTLSSVLLAGKIYRGSYMSAHVLLNLFNKLRKVDKMRDFAIFNIILH